MKTLILTSPHAQGPDVQHLQHLLANHGWYHGQTDGEYGPLTAQAVYRAKFWLGYPKPDHVAGDILINFLTGHTHPSSQMVRTRAARLRAKAKADAQAAIVPLGEKLLEFELTQVGTKESPSGSNHTKYGVWYGVDHQPWCAIFQSFSASRVGLKFHYAYVPAVVADAHAHRNGLSLLARSQVKPGDPVCFDWPGESPGLADHIGCFGGWVDQEKGNFWTVEGNTAIGNNSNGGEVLRREDRLVSEVQAFVRIGGAR